MINRAVLILKYKDPAITWVNEADPIKDNPVITANDVNADRTVYLVSDEVAESSGSLEDWINANYEVLFETELEGWYTDPLLWPANRNRALFNEWFEVECHSVLVDTVGEPIFDDEA